ncbi:MAG: hypothetical protein J5884_04790 [Paludibacteraceae bacterium]|nr:hypothetical protein [Paludibacteraceae bacterium]
MSSFDFIWQLVCGHGSVAENYKAELARVWDEYTLEQQRAIYRSIRDKLRAGKFVNYNPVKAVRENAPQKRPPLILTMNDYYARYGTTEEQDGWRREFRPEEQRTVYIK